MKSYSPGDVLIVYYPFREDPTRLSRRPAMVISKIDKSHYRMAQITGTNRTGDIKGEWIDSNSEEYRSMGLVIPSFINLENILTVPVSLIISGPIGKYPDIKSLFKVYNMDF